MPSNVSTTKIPWHLIMIFLLLSVGIGISGYFYYEVQKEHIKKHIEKELSAIADLKKDQIVNWRKERISMVTMPSRSPFVASGIKEFLRNPFDPVKRKRVLNFITSFKELYNFENIFLLDHNQRVILSAVEGKKLDCPHFLKIASESFQKGKIILTDLHEVETDERIHIGAVTPINDPGKARSTPIALLVFEINPYQFLYPLIQS